MEVDQQQMDLAPAPELPKPKMAFAPWLALGLAGMGAVFLAFGVYHAKDIEVIEPRQVQETSLEATEQSNMAQADLTNDPIGALVRQTIETTANEAKETPSAVVAPRYIQNATPAPQLPAGAKRVVIVIDDVGVTSLSQKVLTLPTEVTLAFLPYGKYTKALSATAREKGHEIMVHIPMEPKSRVGEPPANPGPNALYVADDTATIKVNTLLNLHDLLNIAVGANNHMGSRFTSHLEGMQAVMEIMEKENLFFMDSITTRGSMVTKAAEGKDVPVLRRDVFLDHYEGRENIDKALAQLEQKAQRNGTAIAIGHPHQNTIDAINDWAKTLKEKGIYLVPITGLINE